MMSAPANASPGPDSSNATAENGASSPEAAASALLAEFTRLQVENERLAAESKRAAEDVLRAQAEAENFRKRLRRDTEDQLRYAPLPLLKDLLPVVDNLERAVQAAEGSQQISGLLDGVRMVVTNTLGVLEKHGCRRMQAAGALFDPNLHEAINQMPSADVPAGHVAMVAQAGYQFEERVVRPALVVVSTGQA